MNPPPPQKKNETDRTPAAKKRKTEPFSESVQNPIPPGHRTLRNFALVAGFGIKPTEKPTDKCLISDVVGRETPTETERPFDKKNVKPTY